MGPRCARSRPVKNGRYRDPVSTPRRSWKGAPTAGPCSAMIWNRRSCGVVLHAARLQHRDRALQFAADLHVSQPHDVVGDRRHTVPVNWADPSSSGTSIVRISVIPADAKVLGQRVDELPEPPLRRHAQVERREAVEHGAPRAARCRPAPGFEEEAVGRELDRATSQTMCQQALLLERRRGPSRTPWPIDPKLRQALLERRRGCLAVAALRALDEEAQAEQRLAGPGAALRRPWRSPAAGRRRTSRRARRTPVGTRSSTGTCSAVDIRSASARAG